jgi:hypothetical protein
LSEQVEEVCYLVGILQRRERPDDIFGRGRDGDGQINAFPIGLSESEEGDPQERETEEGNHHEMVVRDERGNEASNRNHRSTDAMGPFQEVSTKTTSQMLPNDLKLK